MKKIAVFEVEFDTEDMISEEDLKEFYNDNWFNFIDVMWNDEGWGIFEYLPKLVEIKEGSDNK